MSISELIGWAGALFGTGGIGVGLRYLFQRERELGRAESYREYATQALATKDKELAVKDAEILRLHGRIAVLEQLLRDLSTEGAR